jgi:predicted anti-sigma-YlaC factor YlaD
MNCERVQRLLALEPPGTTVPRQRALRSHLEACARCRSYWQALATVDRALAARPLACPVAGLADDVMYRVHRRPPRRIAAPFSRAFFVLGAALTLCALVGGALLLHAWSTGPMPTTGGLATLWLNPAWPGDASAWLTVEGEHLAQIVLPAIAGMVISLLGAAVGFRASSQQPEEAPAIRDPTAPRRP